MSIRLIWPFVELVPEHKRAKFVSHLQAALGLGEREYCDPDTRVSMQFAVALLERSMEGPALGLLAAQRVTSEHIGIAEYLARSKPKLGEALTSFDRYLRLLSEGMHQGLDVRDERAYARFWLDGNLELSAAVYEFAVAVRLNVMRRITGVAALAPLEVHFTHMSPVDLGLHRRIFNCPLYFSMPVTQMVLAPEMLALPLVHADPALGRLLERQAKLMLAGLPRADNLAARVRDMLNAETDLSEANAGRIALRLGISVRSLARRLGEEGTGFRELLDERRRQAALRDLARTLRPISDIAQQLGFSTSQSFHRAFRRWTGETAASFRDRARQDELMVH